MAAAFPPYAAPENPRRQAEPSTLSTCLSPAGSDGSQSYPYTHRPSRAAITCPAAASIRGICCRAARGPACTLRSGDPTPLLKLAEMCNGSDGPSAAACAWRCSRDGCSSRCTPCRHCCRLSACFPAGRAGKDGYLQLLGCSHQCFHPLASAAPRMLKMLPSPKAAFHARQQPAASPAAAASSIVREVEAGREPLTR